MIWDRILGHQLQVEMFRRAIARGRLAHGYLLVGPPGIGKHLFARTLAQCLFCERIPDEELDACGECASCRQMQAGHHPDLLTIGLPEGKKILPISLLVGEERNRGRSGLCYEIAMAPMSAGRRIAIIDDAEAMNEEAANSLLKTLEEPPVGSILILLAPDLEPILPTIRSRCQPVRFAPLTNEQVVTLLEAESIPAAQVRDVVDMAEGSLNVARQLLDPGMMKLWKVTESQLKKQAVEPHSAVQQIQAALEELGGDTATQRENMLWVVRFAIESLRRQLAGTDDFHSLDRLGTMLDRCFDAELHLKQTMPVPLCLEALFAELGKRSRVPAGARTV
ncbi:DNA polymerase III subunit delta' [Planctomicrobium sp. SH661]|uniref:DNA polymerase III subunit delta' n=1 Tax=Planctomicrobium sp. SH661 TaxID=3448124 RepID=UPI003F5B1271